MKTYKFAAGGIQCLFCDKISHNTHDIEQKYCSFCKKFHNILLLPLPIDLRPLSTDRVFHISPDVGLPECKCSQCAQSITQGIIRLFTPNNQEYRYHYACIGIAEIEDYDDFDEDNPL
jgi:hypothetical protein